MTWTLRAPLVIVAVATIPAGISVEVAEQVGAWPGWTALAGAAVGLGWTASLWLRRPDDRGALVPGLGAAVLVLAMAGLGLWRGAAEEGTDFGKRALTASPGQRRPGGWIGRTERDGVTFFAVELEAHDATAQRIGAMFEHKFVPLVVTVDNRAGRTAVELDLSAARLEPVRAGDDGVLPRGRVLDSARGGREVAHQLHGGRYVVPPGGRLGDGLVFVDPARDLERTTGITVTANGRSLTIPGRFYTEQEKQAMSKEKRM